MYATVLNDKAYPVGTAFPSICQLSMFSWSTSNSRNKIFANVVYYFKSLVYVTPLMLLLPVMMNKFELIEWICQHGVASSKISSYKDSEIFSFINFGNPLHILSKKKRGKGEHFRCVQRYKMFHCSSKRRG